jgi:hypothetical protein
MHGIEPFSTLCRHLVLPLSFILPHCEMLQLPLCDHDAVAHRKFLPRPQPIMLVDSHPLFSMRFPSPLFSRLVVPALPQPLHLRELPFAQLLKLRASPGRELVPRHLLFPSAHDQRVLHLDKTFTTLSSGNVPHLLFLTLVVEARQLLVEGIGVQRLGAAVPSGLLLSPAKDDFLLSPGQLLPLQCGAHVFSSNCVTHPRRDDIR